MSAPPRRAEVCADEPIAIKAVQRELIDADEERNEPSEEGQTEDEREPVLEPRVIDSVEMFDGPFLGAVDFRGGIGAP